MFEALKKYESMRPVIERCNRVVLETLASSEIREAKIAGESFKNGGKRLRPLLMVLSSMASNRSGSGRVSTPLIELAAAVELIHLATLFHDDVIDEVENRRMKLSARAKYGNFVSVLAGDYVLSEALLLVHRSGMHQTMPEFLKTIRTLVSGESRETNHKFDFAMDEPTYCDIISEKSASLFALSCRVGGMSVQSDGHDALGDFGWHLGMAFQMIDDLDDMLGLPGGSMDCDLQNGYLALPVIRLLTQLQDGHREELVQLLQQPEFSWDTEKRIAVLCTDHGGIEHAGRQIESHLDLAREMLGPFESNDGADMLHRIVEDLRAYAGGQVAGFQAFTRRERDLFGDPRSASLG
jgi:octaprenyl-diphosphate synthase